MMNIYQFFDKLRNFLADKKRERYLNHLVKNGLRLGKNIDIVETFFFDPSHCYLISIGDNCTICPGVRLIAHDASTKMFLGYTKLGRIEIRENCFIGDSSIVLPSVTIGPNAIVGAGSVVTRNVLPNTVVAGNPAKMISPLDEYLYKIRTLSGEKRIFSDEYFISRLDDNKRQELLQSVRDGVGFIV
jgi:maltose O-acetyltransferase